MSEIDTGGPAFPTKDSTEWHEGITMRDYFAAKAMQAYCSGEAWRFVSGATEAAKCAYAMADAMINERNGKNKLLSASVGCLHLDRRALNCLLAEEIETIGDLCNKRILDLQKLPNLGMVSINRIISALAEHGLTLKSQGGRHE